MLAVSVLPSSAISELFFSNSFLASLQHPHVPHVLPLVQAVKDIAPEAEWLSDNNPPKLTHLILEVISHRHVSTLWRNFKLPANSNQCLAPLDWLADFEVISSKFKFCHFLSVICLTLQRYQYAWFT
jgi:hypothetical protein